MARRRATLIAILLTLIVIGGCGRTNDARDDTAPSSDSGHVETDRFAKLLRECQVLRPEQIGRVVGATTVNSVYVGAICRWDLRGKVSGTVTFTWFESGSMRIEQQTQRSLGFANENIRIESVAAFTARDPRRPAVCAVTARAPVGGVYTWWVEPDTAAADPCAAPTKLMQMVLIGGE